jgi:hypothetical protein
MDFLQL